MYFVIFKIVFKTVTYQNMFINIEVKNITCYIHIFILRSHIMHKQIKIAKCLKLKIKTIAHDFIECLNVYMCTHACSCAWMCISVFIDAECLHCIMHYIFIKTIFTIL